MNDQLIYKKPILDIDPAFISRLKALGGSNLVIELINMYLTRGTQLLETIHTGMESKNFDTIKGAAHSLISSAGNLGGQLVSNLSKAIEHSAMESEMENLTILYPELELAQEAFQKYLKDALETL